MERSRKPGMVLKLDISKAYDRVNWNFLCQVLQKFGVGPKLLNLIRECITTAKHSVLVNGVPQEPFRASRGLR